ncbi:MAG: ubiquinone/menaquinone biosynthesis C-methylase UbiE [Paraglaciecola sp.]|jgi:ubiquinone/menaquinone biosynthesis C-methylase UbiE
MGGRMSQSENWSDYWEYESSKGEVFVDKSGNKHPELAEFWKQLFNNFQSTDRIIDLASGAGSIFNSVNYHKFSKLNAVDISGVALKRLQDDIPQVKVQIGSCSKLSFHDMSFDHVLSQFGIEYSTEDGFYEALRVMNVNGDFNALVHYKDGYIDDRNATELEGVELLIDGSFVEISTKIANAFKSKDASITQKHVKEFSSIEPKVHAYCDRHNSGMPAHCYHGCKRLLQDYAKYDHSDVIEWFKNMQQELIQARERIQSMRSVAFSKDRMDKMVDTLKEKGAKKISTEPFILIQHNKPVAWVLKFRKEI